MRGQTDQGPVLEAQVAPSCLRQTLRVRAIDNLGAASNIATYRFWIAPFNDAPTFTAGPSFVVGVHDTPYSAAWATNVSPGPANEAGQVVHFERTANNNPALFSVCPAIASDGTLSFTPASGASGSA